MYIHVQSNREGCAARPISIFDKFKDSETDEVRRDSAPMRPQKNTKATRCRGSSSPNRLPVPFLGLPDANKEVVI